MKYLSVIFILLIMGSTLQSCNENIGKITKAEKSVVYPGVEQGNIYIRYTAHIHLNKPVLLKSVEISDGKSALLLSKFSLVREKDGKIIDVHKEIPKGDYFFKAEILENIAPKSDKDKLIVQFIYKDQSFILKTPVKNAPPIMFK